MPVRPAARGPGRAGAGRADADANVTGRRACRRGPVAAAVLSGTEGQAEAARAVAASYDLFKILHLLGVVVLLGNVTVTSFWKLFADRSGDPRIVAHAAELVILTDWVFTLGGIVALVVGGFGAAWAAGMNPFGAPWLVVAELLFVLSGLIWLFVLVPLQRRLARQARAFRDGGAVTAAYRRDSRRWLVWGLVATAPLLGAVHVMVAKW